jgi:integrase
VSSLARQAEELRQAITTHQAELAQVEEKLALVWDAIELRQFLDDLAGHRLMPAYYLAANTGMRRGEVLGLRWNDVDLEKARLSVRQAVISVAYDVQIADVKTGSSRRTIDLDPRTVSVLREWRKRQLEERLLLGELHQDHGLTFSRPEGSPLHPDFFSQSFERLVARSGLPAIRLHDLRHTHATLLLRAGVPVKVVSERLGHASPAFTMTVYQHVLPGMQAEAATTFGELIYGTV